MGKPENYLCDIFFKNELKDGNNSRFLMIGDRLNTDILFGKNNNFQTLLVETGVHKLHHVQAIIDELVNGKQDIELENQIPDFILSSLGDMFNNNYE
jgi:phosphoglycolate phosphatase